MDVKSADFGTIRASGLIRNLDTECAVLHYEGHALPLTRNHGKKRTNYLCCPSAAYLDYAIDELRHFSAHAWLKPVLHGLIEACRPLMALSGLDRQVQPNNWLVATNLLPDLADADIKEITKDLAARHPDHVIIWRSVNDRSMAHLKVRFENAGYRAFPSRQIYLFDARTVPPPVRRDERRDMKLLELDDYQWTQGPWEDGDFERMAWLYQKLYLDKYTWLNPVYTPAFIQSGHASGFLELEGLRNRDGQLDGIVGFIDNGDTMAAPIVGYDTGLSTEAGLYRRLMAMAIRRARERRRLYNMSAGAAAFKRNRGGVASLEYIMAYDRHLGFSRRLTAGLVRGIINSVGVPLLKHFEL
jgi:hypothetical protein